jgi:outer membrane protein TolC
MLSNWITRTATTGVIGLGLLAGGCVLKPHGADEEKARLDRAGEAYQPPVEKRSLPALPAPATWQAVLQRAFLANGDLEAAYFEWAAAYHRIDMAATWPNSNVQVGFEYMFSSERMKSWDRTTVSAGFDPAMNLSFPTKVAKAGEQALESARAAGLRFAARKFAIQKQVLQAYLDLALMDEQLRIQGDNVSLLKLISDTAGDRVRAGAPQQDLLKAQIQHRLAEAELSKMQAQRESMRAMLNGMLARGADEAIEMPPQLPEARPVAADDGALIAVATDANPELSALSRDVAARQDALELARMRFIPDINPVAAFTGSMSQSLGAMVMLPTTIPMIRASIEEARAMLRASEAMSRQARNDRAASFVAALYAMRNAERLVGLYRDTVLPKAEQALASSRQAYAAGQIGFIELIDSQRTLLDVRVLIAQARVEREKRLAEMESLAGVDVETLGGVKHEDVKHEEVKP